MSRRIIRFPLKVLLPKRTEAEAGVPGLTLIEPTRVHKYPFNSFIARNILFSMIWGKGAPCKLAFGGTKGVFKLFSLFFLHLTPSLIIFFIWT